MNASDPVDGTDLTFGLFVPTIGPPATAANLRRIAGAAETHGFASLWAGEHAVFTAEMSNTYPFTSSGEPPSTFGADARLLDVFESLSYLAGVTSSITVGTNVCLAPLYHPVAVTKRAFTLEALSEGRFEFGVSTGWLPEEYEVLDVPFEERGSRLDEFLEVFERARTEGRLAHEGPHHAFQEAGFRPTPAAGRPPVWIGGKSGATFRRVAEFGDGWTIVRDTPGQVARARERLLNAWRDYDREGEPAIALARPVHVGPERGTDSPLAGPPESVREDVRAYADAGVTHIALMFYTLDVDEQLEQLERFATEVAPHV